LQEIIIKLIRYVGVYDLLIKPTTNVSIQLFRTLFVSGAAFIVDAGLLWILSQFGLHYLIGTVVGFLVGVSVHYFLSVNFVFMEKAAVGKAKEVVIYITIGVVGLALTVLFMWLFTDVAGLFFMVSRALAMIIVFIWNFVMRKLVLYSHTERNKE